MHGMYTLPSNSRVKYLLKFWTANYAIKAFKDIGGSERESVTVVELGTMHSLTLIGVRELRGLETGFDHFYREVDSNLKY